MRQIRRVCEHVRQAYFAEYVLCRLGRIDLGPQPMFIRPIRGAITPNIAAVLRGEREADAALAGELAAMGLL